MKNNIHFNLNQLINKLNLLLYKKFIIKYKIRNNFIKNNNILKINKRKISNILNLINKIYKNKIL